MALVCKHDECIQKERLNFAMQYSSRSTVLCDFILKCGRCWAIDSVKDKKEQDQKTIKSKQKTTTKKINIKKMTSWHSNHDRLSVKRES